MKFNLSKIQENKLFKGESIVVKPYKFATTAVANTSDLAVNCFVDKHNYSLKLFYDRSQFEKKRTLCGSDLIKNDGSWRRWFGTEPEEMKLYHRDYEMVKTVIPDYISIKGRDDEKEARVQYKREQVSQTIKEIKDFYVNEKEREKESRTKITKLRKKLAEAQKVN